MQNISVSKVYVNYRQLIFVTEEVEFETASY